MSEKTTLHSCAKRCRIQKNARRAFFEQTEFDFKGLTNLSSHEHGNESQHENQYSAAHGQNDGHHRNNGLDHIGGFSVV
jgi:hypothetical protein